MNGYLANAASCENRCTRTRECKDPVQEQNSYEVYSCHSSETQYFKPDLECGMTCNFETCCQNSHICRLYTTDSNTGSRGQFQCTNNEVFNPSKSELGCLNAADC